MSISKFFLHLVLVGALLGFAGTSHSKAKPAPKPAVKAPKDITPFGLSGLPIQFYQTWEYKVYVITHKGSTTNARVGGVISLGPKGTFERNLELPGPYGSYTFSETGRFRMESIKKSGDSHSGKITFIYSNSKGQPVNYGGTFSFNLKALSLVLTLNESKEGKEVFGLFIKGTEKLKRRFDEKGNVVFE